MINLGGVPECRSDLCIRYDPPASVPSPSPDGGDGWWILRNVWSDYLQSESSLSGVQTSSVSSQLQQVVNSIFFTGM